jgi:tetratricopeptide (TPR) repeat protein
MTTKLQWRRITAWVVPFAVGLILAGDVRAQSTARPWTRGVSQERQMRAKVFYHAGNRFLADSQFAAAVTAYRGALQHWDHPGIHYNLALALIGLDRPTEAYEATLDALSYGPDALQPDDYQRALDYQRLLRKQIVKVEIVCAERDADVSLDGKRLFTGPGRVTTMVTPGTHEIVASKPKYITSREAFTAKAAEHVRIEFRLIAKHRTPDTPHAEQ